MYDNSLAKVAVVDGGEMDDYQFAAFFIIEKFQKCLCLTTREDVYGDSALMWGLRGNGLLAVVSLGTIFRLVHILYSGQKTHTKKGEPGREAPLKKVYATCDDTLHAMLEITLENPPLVMTVQWNTKYHGGNSFRASTSDLSASNVFSDSPSEVSTARALDLPLPRLAGAAFCFFGFGWGSSSSSEVVSSLPVFAGGDAGCGAGAGAGDGDGGSGGGGAGKFSRVANGLDTAGFVERGIGRGCGMLQAGEEGGGSLEWESYLTAWDNEGYHEPVKKVEVCLEEGVSSLKWAMCDVEVQLGALSPECESSQQHYELPFYNEKNNKDGLQVPALQQSFLVVVR
ncbi:uncharacterized protein HD556DRAFT_1311192 [Suillus plorans]|uniref:Uncharacterized protein n=1 Tax=Suillus plorans TaxID=116603 RepID=A0A9P7AIK1_9AGAM|nr:uncharacterized protein HD556DRAFT_1311192 [Suillus plorans]KAG1789598.1 hypothetical protein HD556DRAFT_1311192 [Suillus plorans]